MPVNGPFCSLFTRFTSFTSYKLIVGSKLGPAPAPRGHHPAVYGRNLSGFDDKCVFSKLNYAITKTKLSKYILFPNHP